MNYYNEATESTIEGYLITIKELSNIIFSLEQAVISNPEWSRILRKDIKKIKQLRKKGIIYGKYINK